MTTSFWETPTVQCFPGSELEDSPPPGSHPLGSIFGLGRLDVVECAVSPVIRGLKPAEVRTVIMCAEPFMERTLKKVSNEN